MKNEKKIPAIQIQELKAQIQEGKDSGDGRPADMVFNRLESKYKDLVNESK